MNSGLVALKTAKKLTFENTKKCYRQRTANMEQTGRETNYRGPSNRFTDILLLFFSCTMHNKKTIPLMTLLLFSYLTKDEYIHG